MAKYRTQVIPNSEIHQ